MYNRNATLLATKTLKQAPEKSHTPKAMIRTRLFLLSSPTCTSRLSGAVVQFMACMTSAAARPRNLFRACSVSRTAASSRCFNSLLCASIYIRLIPRVESASHSSRSSLAKVLYASRRRAFIRSRRLQSPKEVRKCSPSWNI